MENRKLFGLALMIAVLFLGLSMLLAGHLVLANDEDENETEVEDVNETEFTEVPSDVGKFGLIGTISAVNATDKTIAVNGVSIDVSEAKIVGWKWKKLAERVGRPWKDWWREWTPEDLKVGDKVRVGGRIENGKLIARLVVLHAWRIAEKVKQCEVDADCPAVPAHLQEKFEMKCVEAKCKLVRKETATTTVVEEEEEEEEEEERPERPGVPFRLQDIQDRLNEILKKIQELQSRLGAVVGRAL